MPTTAQGVVYTPEYSTTSDGGACRWFMRDDRKGGLDPVPVLLYVHGSGEDGDAFSWIAWNTLRDLLVNAGWAVVEGEGGGPSNWGGPVTQDLYREMFTWVSTKINPGVLVIMALSMGGIGAYNIATKGTLANRHSALIIQSGTTDLIARYSDHDRPAYAGLNRAFGVPGTTYQPEAFATAAQSYDPMQFPLSAWAGKRVRQVWGAQDTSVAPGPHGQAWVAKYGTSTLATSVYVNDPGGHTPLAADQVSTFAFMQSLIPAKPPIPDRPYTIGSITVIK